MLPASVVTCSTWTSPPTPAAASTRWRGIAANGALGVDAGPVHTGCGYAPAVPAAPSAGQRGSGPLSMAVAEYID